ncbi:MAG TPA: septal ring lytic transglycosylase RlpA family protein [Myxococcales bacterium]|nr:septal ring lytic transglycosylase RlpA family protein [Myxococcales bacterium]
MRTLLHGRSRWLLAVALLAPAACLRMRAPPPPLPMDFREEGRATYYGSPSSNVRSGKVAVTREWDPGMMTGSHRTLPLGSCVEVQNLENGMDARVHITDRGAYTPGVIIDLSFAAAKRLGMIDTRNGAARVRLTPCG